MSKLCKFPVCPSSGIQTGFCGSICLCSGVMPTSFVPHFCSFSCVALHAPQVYSILVWFTVFFTILKTNQAGNRTNSISLICLHTVWFLLLSLLPQLVALIALPPPASSSSSLSSSLCPFLDFLQARRDSPILGGTGIFSSPPPPPPCIHVRDYFIGLIWRDHIYD